MPDDNLKRKPYQGAYRSELEVPITHPNEPTDQDADFGNTSNDDLSPQEQTWKKRYGDARSHMQKLSEENKSLKEQLRNASKEKFQMPSTEQEIVAFAQRYPDFTRHIRSLAMVEIMQQKKELEQEQEQVKKDLETLKREKALEQILLAHRDFHELNNSREFHEWVQNQPRSIQNMVYESDNPDDCIVAIDLYKSTLKPKSQPKPRSTGADALVRTKSPVNPGGGDDESQRIWKASEIGLMHPREYEAREAEIERARREGRIDMNA